MANTTRKKSGKEQQALRIKATKTTAIVLIALIILAAAACLTLYFGLPDVWADFVSLFTKEPPPSSQGTLQDGALNFADGALNFADGDLSVHYVDVGQGDCILILFPDGKDMLIDCANYNNTGSIKTTALNYLDMYLTDGQIDYVMLTHCDSDHAYFLDDVLDRYDVDNIYMPNVMASNKKIADASLDETKLDKFTDKDKIDSGVYADFFIAALTEPNCSIRLNVDPDEDTNTIVLDGDEYDYTFTFYCPTQDYYDNYGLNTAERKNAISPIGVLEYNSFHLVFTGDSNEINEPVFINRIGGYLDCDVLKVGHHGSETSSTDAFLDAVNCEFAVISCNASGNSFNHPRQTTLDRFADRQTTVFRTDNNGNIVLIVNTGLSFLVQTSVEQSVNLRGLL